VKIAHISDIHIKNNKSHDEYKSVFEKLYRSLVENKVEYIVITGDVAHSKTQISPEYVDIANGLFTNLADLAPLLVIPGNHDGNLKNLDRMDAIEPIIKSVTAKNTIFYNRRSFRHDVRNFSFYHLSVFDELNWDMEVDSERTNIALYHGCINGAKTDMGHALKGEHSDGIFKKYDFAMLGDIHKSNQILEDRKSVV